MITGERLFEAYERIERKFLARPPRTVGSIGIRQVVMDHPGIETVYLDFPYDHHDLSCYLFGVPQGFIRKGGTVEVIVQEIILPPIFDALLKMPRECYVAARPFERNIYGKLGRRDLLTLDPIFKANLKSESMDAMFFQRFMERHF